MIWLAPTFVALLGCTEEQLEEYIPVPSEGEVGRMQGFTHEHNLIREDLGIPDLTYDQALGDLAAEWLEVLVNERDCALDHNLDSPLGENLAWNNGFESNPGRVVDGWAAEEAFYDYDANSCSDSCGHYTQIVWADTERLGCAIADCLDGAEIWMCNYDPPGNITGESPY